MNRTIVIVALAAALLVLPLFTNPYWTDVCVSIGLYALLALSLNVILGQAGIFHMGHAAFFAVGAYSTAILNTMYHWPIFLTMPVAGCAAALFALVVARPIIHLGATSCYVTDNADLLLLREALGLIRGKLCEALRALGDFALKTKDIPCVGLTHLQAAQPLTVGRRAACWAQDLLQDLTDLDALLPSIKLLGCRGATGTQASFLDLFDGDVDKVETMEQAISQKLGGLPVFDVSGQTYPRKLDARVLNLLASLGISCYRFAQDVRLLQSRGEMEEPFGSSQIGSSAMAYKRNPIRAERACSLSRHLIALSQDAAMTACTQWCERTLDDSANRRIALPEAFLTADAVLDIVIYLARGLVVYPKMCERGLRDALPFIATENIMMEAVKKGGDRQSTHERIRAHAQAAAVRMKEEGTANDLLQRIVEDPSLPLTQEELSTLLEPSKYIGLAPRQTERFVTRVLRPAIGQDGCADAGNVVL